MCRGRGRWREVRGGEVWRLSVSLRVACLAPEPVTHGVATAVLWCVSGRRLAALRRPCRRLMRPKAVSNLSPPTANTAPLHKLESRRSTGTPRRFSFAPSAACFSLKQVFRKAGHISVYGVRNLIHASPEGCSNQHHMDTGH